MPSPTSTHRESTLTALDAMEENLRRRGLNHDGAADPLHGYSAEDTATYMVSIRSAKEHRQALLREKEYRRAAAAAGSQATMGHSLHPTSSSETGSGIAKGTTVGRGEASGATALKATTMAASSAPAADEEANRPDLHSAAQLLQQETARAAATVMARSKAQETVRNTATQQRALAQATASAEAETAARRTASAAAMVPSSQCHSVVELMVPLESLTQAAPPEQTRKAVVGGMCEGLARGLVELAVRVSDQRFLDAEDISGQPVRRAAQDLTVTDWKQWVEECVFAPSGQWGATGMAPTHLFSSGEYGEERGGADAATARGDAATVVNVLASSPLRRADAGGAGPTPSPTHAVTEVDGVGTPPNSPKTEAATQLRYAARQQTRLDTRQQRRAVEDALGYLREEGDRLCKAALEEVRRRALDPHGAAAQHHPDPHHQQQSPQLQMTPPRTTLSLDAASPGHAGKPVAASAVSPPRTEAERREEVLPGWTQRMPPSGCFVFGDDLSGVRVLADAVERLAADQQANGVVGGGGGQGIAGGPAEGSVSSAASATPRRGKASDSEKLAARCSSSAVTGPGSAIGAVWRGNRDGLEQLYVTPRTLFGLHLGKTRPGSGVGGAGAGRRRSHSATKLLTSMSGQATGGGTGATGAGSAAPAYPSGHRRGSCADGSEEEGKEVEALLSVLVKELVQTHMHNLLVLARPGLLPTPGSTTATTDPAHSVLGTDSHGATTTTTAAAGAVANTTATAGNAAAGGNKRNAAAKRTVSPSRPTSTSLAGAAAVAAATVETAGAAPLTIPPPLRVLLLIGFPDTRRFHEMLERRLSAAVEAAETELTAAAVQLQLQRQQAEAEAAAAAGGAALPHTLSPGSTPSTQQLQMTPQQKGGKSPAHPQPTPPSLPKSKADERKGRGSRRQPSSPATAQDQAAAEAAAALTLLFPPLCVVGVFLQYDLCTRQRRLADAYTSTNGSGQAGGTSQSVPSVGATADGATGPLYHCVYSPEATPTGAVGGGYAAPASTGGAGVSSGVHPMGAATSAAAALAGGGGFASAASINSSVREGAGLVNTSGGGVAKGTGAVTPSQSALSPLPQPRLLASYTTVQLRQALLEQDAAMRQWQSRWVDAVSRPALCAPPQLSGGAFSFHTTGSGAAASAGSPGAVLSTAAREKPSRRRQMKSAVHAVMQSKSGGTSGGSHGVEPGAAGGGGGTGGGSGVRSSLLAEPFHFPRVLFFTCEENVSDDVAASRPATALLSKAAGNPIPVVLDTEGVTTFFDYASVNSATATTTTAVNVWMAVEEEKTVRVDGLVRRLSERVSGVGPGRGRVLSHRSLASMQLPAPLRLTDYALPSAVCDELLQTHAEYRVRLQELKEANGRAASGAFSSSPTVLTLGGSTEGEEETAIRAELEVRRVVRHYLSGLVHIVREESFPETMSRQQRSDMGDSVYYATVDRSYAANTARITDAYGPYHARLVERAALFLRCVLDAALAVTANALEAVFHTAIPLFCPPPLPPPPLPSPSGAAAGSPYATSLPRLLGAPTTSAAGEDDAERQPSVEHPFASHSASLVVAGSEVGGSGDGAALGLTPSPAAGLAAHISSMTRVPLHLLAALPRLSHSEAMALATTLLQPPRDTATPTKGGENSEEGVEEEEDNGAQQLGQFWTQLAPYIARVTSAAVDKLKGTIAEVAAASAPSAPPIAQPGNEEDSVHSGHTPGPAAAASPSTSTRPFAGLVSLLQEATSLHAVVNRVVASTLMVPPVFTAVAGEPSAASPRSPLYSAQTATHNGTAYDDNGASGVPRRDGGVLLSSPGFASSAAATIVVQGQKGGAGSEEVHKHSAPQPVPPLQPASVRLHDNTHEDHTTARRDDAQVESVAPSLARAAVLLHVLGRSAACASAGAQQWLDAQYTYLLQHNAATGGAVPGSLRPRSVRQLIQRPPSSGRTAVPPPSLLPPPPPATAVMGRQARGASPQSAVGLPFSAVPGQQRKRGEKEKGESEEEDGMAALRWRADQLHLYLSTSALYGEKWLPRNAFVHCHVLNQLDKLCPLVADSAASLCAAVGFPPPSPQQTSRLPSSSARRRVGSAEKDGPHGTEEEWAVVESPLEAWGGLPAGPSLSLDALRQLFSVHAVATGGGGREGSREREYATASAEVVDMRAWCINVLLRRATLPIASCETCTVGKEPVPVPTSRAVRLFIASLPSSVRKQCAMDEQVSVVPPSRTRVCPPPCAGWERIRWWYPVDAIQSYLWWATCTALHTLTWHGVRYREVPSLPSMAACLCQRHRPRAASSSSFPAVDTGGSTAASDLEETVSRLFHVAAALQAAGQSNRRGVSGSAIAASNVELSAQFFAFLASALCSTAADMTNCVQIPSLLQDSRLLLQVEQTPAVTLPLLLSSHWGKALLSAHFRCA